MVIIKKSGLHIVAVIIQSHFCRGFCKCVVAIVDEKIITPRRETPRLHVAAGSVGIAGAQTGIYPVDSPGGWQRNPAAFAGRPKPDLAVGMFSRARRSAILRP